jgi:citrate lyase beta subunit|tara:strand:+ start:864 stop:1697 length:834 start_codon:yes stop_codon:yes gene_type:complete
MLVRSVLFTPATRLDRLERALKSGADLVILDLEDGVGFADKTDALKELGKFANDGLGEVRDKVGVRINAMNTKQGIYDVAALLDWPVFPSYLVLPKVNSANEISQIYALTNEHRVKTLITLETAHGLANASEILRVAPKSSLVAYGSADHMAEVGGLMSETSLAWGRGQISNAAATVPVPVLDGVWLDYSDLKGLRTEAILVKSMGFSGKIAIHPDQIPVINEVFTPSEAEISEAIEMLNASEIAGGGAFSFNGKMIDAPVLARAHLIKDFIKRSKI